LRLKSQNLHIGQVEWGKDVSFVYQLLQQYAYSLPFDLSYQNFDAELAGLPAPYAPPDGSLLLAKMGAVPVGIVGLKRVDGATGEIKRLYVVPEARGCGIGKALLERVLDEALEKGYRRVRLDSHRASMTTAATLYRRLGFKEIPPYGPDLDGAIAFFEKVLDVSG
jgi:GNAT superfamily N-acetyltransferase